MAWNPDTERLSALNDAYLGAEYQVGDIGWTIRIGHFHPQIDDWLQVRNCTCWAFLTAWNPQGEWVSRSENEAQNKQLAADLENLLVKDGFGADPSGAWEGEDCFWVAGLELNEALALAEKYDQLAIVWGRKGGPATLYWT